jgi:hypothetical protein
MCNNRLLGIKRDKKPKQQIKREKKKLPKKKVKLLSKLMQSYGQACHFRV